MIQQIVDTISNTGVLSLLELNLCQARQFQRQTCQNRRAMAQARHIATTSAATEQIVDATMKLTRLRRCGGKGL